jgi:hypothetical protein
MILCSLNQILKILNRSEFVSKISFKNGLQLDYNKSQGFICKIVMPHDVRTLG